MEPRIQYATTSDGVSIAFAVFGSGPPIVFASNIFGSLHMRSGLLPQPGSLDGLVAAGRSVVLYDGRGMGSSDRDVTDFSLQARLRDLEAVVDRLDFDRFALAGVTQGSPTAVAYAADHPEKLSHLILSNPFARGADYYEAIPAMRLLKAMKEMAEDQWEFVTLSLASAISGFSDSAYAQRIAAAMRTGMSARAFVLFRDAAELIDVTSLLPRVRVPTLVTRDETFISAASLVRAVAAGIPNAHFVATTDLAAAIDEFLGEGEEAAARAEPTPAGAFRTLLFTDVEGSTALTQRLGDAKAREVMREHERITREALKAHGGAEVKTMGDGFMASFASATKALECAVAVQRAFEERDASLPAHPEALEGRAEPQPSAHASRASARADSGVGALPDEPIRVRIGLNAGEPIAEDDPDGRGDLFGTAVIMASRIAAQAQGGEILVSDVVRQLVAGKGFLFSDRGESVLRGFEDPVRVYEVRWREGE